MLSDIHDHVAHGRLDEARELLYHLVAADPTHLGALWGLYEVEQALGNPSAAREAQQRALALQAIVHVATMIRQASPQRLSRPIEVLMLCQPGMFQANTPLEYIANGNTLRLSKWYLTDGPTPALPPYDIVFTAIGHSPDPQPALERACAFVASQDRPVVNHPRRITDLARDHVATQFATSERVVVPATQRITREALARRTIDTPLLLRPLTSQAGEGLERIATPSERDRYLTMHADVATFYLSTFIDYRSNDGLYRKYRILFLDGKAYPVHLAISPRWMIHYYNAPMSEHAWMRAEEEDFLDDLGSVFNNERAEALEEIAMRLPFEYFAIDCSIDREGRIVLFEADTAMLVHQADSIEAFPYKHRAMPRIVEALDTFFIRRLIQRL